MTATTEPSPSAQRPGRTSGIGLSLRLFAAMALIVLAGAATLLVVALLVAPPVFQNHLRMATGGMAADTQHHVNEAFTRAILLSLGIAVVVATLAALTVTWLVSRRIAAPVTDLATAARRLAAGGHDTRVTDPGLGPEFGALTASFNTMARQMAATERVRQRMLADLAHELRTPLASIQATVEAVADGVLAPEPTTWATLTEQSTRLGRLVDDIAAVSHAEERSLNLDPHPQSLGDLAAAAVTSVQARYTAKGVLLTLHISHDNPTVLVDAHRLAEALDNLLDNALRHTPPGGQVTITTNGGHEFGRETAGLVVTDNGGGFDPAHADRLFERFYRADPARTHNAAGSGIGLAITKAIVNAHGGRIHAHSDGPEQGAAFEITLPAAPRPTI